MNISLDYDDTFTRDPIGWLEFIKLMQSRGHKVMCVTMRHEYQGYVVKEDLAKHVEIFFTGHKAKEKFMYDRGIRIDVWVDDMPWAVNYDADMPRGGIDDEC